MEYRNQRLKEFMNLEERESSKIPFEAYSYILYNKYPWESFNDYLKDDTSLNKSKFDLHNSEMNNYDEYDNCDGYDNYDEGYDNYDGGYDNYEKEEDIDYDNYDIDFNNINIKCSEVEEYHTDEEYDIEEDFYHPCYKKFNYY